MGKAGVHMINAMTLNTVDYNFETFAHQGLGGTRKYIATPKREGLPKLLVKHGGEFSPSCSNYVYSRIGSAVGVKTPQAFLFNIAKQDRHLFDSPCAVGLEWIEDISEVNVEEIKDDQKLEKDFINCFVLFALFTNFEDNMQCVYVPGIAVYPLDFDESFGMTNGLFRCILRGGQLAEDAVVSALRACQRISIKSQLNIAMKVAADALNIPVNEVRAVAAETIQRFCDMTDDEVIGVTDAFCEAFPNYLAIYYEEYITVIQDVVKKYLAEYDHV